MLIHYAQQGLHATQPSSYRCNTLPSLHSQRLRTPAICNSDSPVRALLTGSVHGGQQPVVGAHIYLFAANTTGYGGAGIAASGANASLSLLNATTTGLADSIGAYVTTDAHGSFTITGDYNCTPNTQVYLYALGGDPGAGVNSAAGLLAVLGNCPSSGSFLASIPFVNVNEVTTIAAAYAFAGYATDAIHVSSSGTPLAQTGIANAFANAANLADISTGNALAAMPAGIGTVPQTTINTLANILASCINSASASSAACTTLFANTESGGTTGTTPSDTATAAINLAHNPGGNTWPLFSLLSGTPPFQPQLASAPNDYSLSFTFNLFRTITGPTDLEVDASGNIWISNTYGNSILGLNGVTGALTYGTSGITGGNISRPEAIAIDTAQNLWVINAGNTGITKINGTNGTILSPAGGYASGLTYPGTIAIDPTGNVWLGSGGSGLAELNGATGDPIVSNSSAPAGTLAFDQSGILWALGNTSNNGYVFKFDGSGNQLQPTSGYGPLPFALTIAIDRSGNIWSNDAENGYGLEAGRFLYEVGGSTSAILSPGDGFGGGGLYNPSSVAIDGSNTVWASSLNAGSISRFDAATGNPLSTPNGYSTNSTLAGVVKLAIDGSGNVWILDSSGNQFAEFVGIASPVVTPIAAAVANHSQGNRPDESHTRRMCRLRF